MEQQWASGRGAEAAVDFPSLAGVIGLGRSVGCDDVQPREVSPGPHLLYIACATGAHQPCVAEYPRSGRGQRVRIGRWANSVEIYSNILPLDLNLSFNLKLCLPFLSLFFCSITNQCIEHASSSRSVADRFNSYNTHL
jgi:hypothetical protein